MRSLFTAATGMEAQQVRIDTIANNLANVNTTGFKKARADFEDLFYETLKAPGASAADGSELPVGAQVGHGVKLGAITRVHSQGDRVAAGRDLDLAIEGDGYFQIESASGETLYTRDGSFQLSRDGNLVTRQGQLLLPGVQVPLDTEQITILPDGSVSGIAAGAIAPSLLGRIELARFANPAGLRTLGGNLYAASSGSGDAEVGTPNQAGFGAVAQGFLESSNVNMAEELVRMILAQRGFEVNSRVISASDEMLQRAANL
jgi:flagellar basal-body rod protein FlgG